MQTYLKNRFLFLHAPFIESAMRQFNNHLYPAYHALLSNTLKPRVGHPEPTLSFGDAHQSPACSHSTIQATRASM